MIAAFYSTVLVERFKADVSFSGELNKTRAEKLGEAWEQVYRFKAVNDSLVQAMADQRDPKLPDAQFYPGAVEVVTATSVKHRSMKTELEKQIQAGRAYAQKRVDDLFRSSNTIYEQVTDTANKNRFWLGEDNYREILSFVSLLSQYEGKQIMKIQNGPDSKDNNNAEIEKLKQQIDQHLTSINAISQRLLNEPTPSPHP